MAVNSYLWYEDGSLKDSEFEDDSNVYKVEASDSYSTDTAGDYRMAGVHWGTHPPGYEPPGYYAETETDWEYVGP